MNNQIENRISMYLKVETMLNNHTADTSSIAIIAVEKTNFSNKLAQLLSKASIASLDITGNTVDKQDKRDSLTKTTLIVGRALTLHSNLTNNKLLNEKFDLTISSIEKMRDSEFYIYALSVKDAATPIITSLVPFSITSALMTQFNNELTAFYSVIQKPKDQISEQSIIREEMENILNDIEKLLTNKLDIALSLFQFSNPSLYSLYINARSVDSTSSTRIADFEGTVLPGEIKLVSTLPHILSRGYKIKNNSNVEITASLSSSLMMEGQIFQIAPNSESQVLLTSALNSNPNANNLLIENNKTIEANFKVYIEE